MKVLFIADESPVRERLAGVISELPDIQVEIGEPRQMEVDQMITQIHPDVVLIDIDLSGGRGLEIIRQTHRQREEHVPVIIAIANSASPAIQSELY